VFASNASIVEFSYTPSSIYVGEKALLTRSATNAKGCKNNYGNSLSLNGSWNPVRNTAGTFTGSITCTGLGGSNKKSSCYTVKNYPAPTIEYSYTPSSVYVGEKVLLT
jgi:hypothetical protein